MTVQELIEKLTNLPQDAMVETIYDGQAGIDINVCYLANSGNVIIAKKGEWLYNKDHHPSGLDFNSIYMAGEGWKGPYDKGM